MSKGFHTRHRADSKHHEILRALKLVTPVRDLHNYGGGIGDILARHTKTGQAMFLEVKSKRGDKLTPSEKAFSVEFDRNHVVVYCVEDAFYAIGLDVVQVMG